MYNVLVLLSVYNGKQYIKPLLESVLNQKNVNLDILVRDDGSNDNTIDIIKGYNEPCIHVVRGNNLGYAKSFWSLLQNAGEYDYYAFCDQDDIWQEEKLYNAIKMLEKEDISIPLLYTSRVVSVDDNMKKLSENCFDTNRVINVYESLQRSIIPGCVFVFNNCAKECLKMYTGYIESHDWATYVIVNTLGKVVYDDNSYILYRIHEGNAIGRVNSIKLFIIRIKRLFKKSKCSRSRFAHDFYCCYKERIDMKYKEDIYMLGFYKTSINEKLKLLLNKKYKGLIFRLLVIMNRV